MKLLGIETSCDETAAAVVEDGRRVLSSVVASSVEEQALYGGIVPEIASRRHIEAISGVVEKALADAGVTAQGVDAVAVTAAPGLIGALLVGVNFAKGLAFAAGKPLVPVHHLRGHVASLYLTHPGLAPPFLCLVASGGHCHYVRVDDYTHFTVLGRTVDDAAGEAFDKVARTLGLGYPGGPAISAAAQAGSPTAYTLPTPKAPGPYDVSFSGLKTAVMNLANQAAMKGEALDVPGLAASFQQKVADILTDKLMAAAAAAGSRTVCLAGGVAANSLLRQLAAEKAALAGLALKLCALEYSGDNAAMIAAQGYYEYSAGHTAGPALNAWATWPMEEDFSTSRQD
ncbi:MAG: tRNA (adenosine(37)-N6)-threonylcarbamoyltransferase complex transferase subunit TsaD [Ruminococcaceae bacterium]|nr:tRNA (adenosine(37)-N6)-threonylcarbamoyltransferase complex transferase subunit TsaD [Oscillospiraceae bacterium]